MYEPRNERETCVCGTVRKDVPGRVWRLFANLHDQANHGYYYRCPVCWSFSAINLYFPAEAYQTRPLETYAPIIDTHMYNSARIRWVRDRVILPEHPVFGDLGAGTGIFLDYATRYMSPARAIAVETDVRLRDRFYGQYGRRVEFVEATVEQFLNCDDCPRFDLVSLNDVLEHLVHPDRILEKVTARLNPGGYVLITVPTSRGILGEGNTRDGYPRPEPGEFVDWTLANRSREHLWLLEPKALIDLVCQQLDILEYSGTFETQIRRDWDYALVLAQKPAEPPIPGSVMRAVQRRGGPQI